MIDERHAEDTLFFLIEEDWRLFESDCVAPSLCALDYQSQELKKQQFRGFGRVQPQIQVSTDDESAPLLPADSVGAQVALDVAQQERLVSNMDFRFFMPAPSQPDDAAVVENSACADIVAHCTAAARCGLGHIVWLSWNPSESPKKKDVLMYASTMIAFTPKGARYLLNDMKNAEPQHVDYYLLNFLRRCEQNDSPVKGSYICPAFGNYVEHESQSTANFGQRKSLWHLDGVQPGTRPYHASHEHRWVMGFGAKKGKKVYKCQVKLPQDLNTLKWRTWANPSATTSKAAGATPFPPPPPPIPKALPQTAQGSSSASGSRGTPVYSWKRQAQDRVPERSLEAVHADAAEGPLTKRQKRTRRKNKLLASFREWAPSLVPWV